MIVPEVTASFHRWWSAVSPNLKVFSASVSASSATLRLAGLRGDLTAESLRTPRLTHRIQVMTVPVERDHAASQQYCIDLSGLLTGSALTAFQPARYTLGLSSEPIFWRELTVAYAIIQAGGKQFRVSEGEVVRVPTINAEVGASVELDSLLQTDGDSIQVGLAGNQVKATVVEHGRGKKVIVFKKKRRKQYKKIHGHRQDFTAVLIESIGTTSDKND